MSRFLPWIRPSLVWAALVLGVVSFMAWYPPAKQRFDDFCDYLQRRSMEDVTLFLSFAVFTWIVYVLTAILIVFLIVGCRTRMQRAWRSKVIAFNLIVWRSLILSITNRDGIPQPWALIFWVVVGYFIADFAIGFYQTWILPIYSVHPALRPVLAVLTLGLLMLSVYLAVMAGMV